MNRTRILIAAILLGSAIALPNVGDAIGGTYRFSEKDVEEIIGEVQKPDVTVVISRENLNKAYKLELSESFLDKILESVEQAPF